MNIKGALPSKLLLVVVAVLIAGAAVYLLLPKAQELPSDPFAGYPTEITSQLSPEKQTQTEEEIAALTTQINDKVAAGEYALDLYFMRGGDYQRLGHLQLAFADFETVVSGDPHNETAWNNMGDILVTIGNIEPAEAFYKQAIEATPSENTYNKLYRYYTQYREDDRFEAIGPLLTEAIAAVQSKAPFYVKLGRWYLDKGDKEQAVRSFEAALELDPENQELKMELDAAKML